MGLAYVLTGNGGVVVLDGPRLVEVIPWPDTYYRDRFKFTHGAIHPHTGQVYVTDEAGMVHVIRGTEVITTLSTGGVGPANLAVDERRGYIYVTNADSHRIAVFGFEEGAELAAALF